MTGSESAASSSNHVVVTGGLGFIGSHVVDGYLEAGARVTVIDSEIGPAVDGAEYDSHPHCEVVRKSLTEFFADGGNFAGVDLVIHAASLVGPAGILKYGGRLGTEITATAQGVVDACLEHDVPLCTFSSAEVYGRSGLLAEGDTILVTPDYNVRIEYAVAKTLTEVLTFNNRHRGLRAIAIRPFNVAGPRQSKAGGFVMPTFVQQALAGDPLTVFDTGKQLRAFLSVMDLQRFMLQHLPAALEGERFVYNVGSPDNRITVWDLAHRVRDFTQSESPIVMTDAKTIHGPLYEEAESFEKTPVLDAALSLGWEPQIKLDTLIQETIDYYAAQRP